MNELSRVLLCNLKSDYFFVKGVGRRSLRNDGLGFSSEIAYMMMAGCTAIVF
jgi:hypothetical protein